MWSRAGVGLSRTERYGKKGRCGDFLHERSPVAEKTRAVTEHKPFAIFDIDNNIKRLLEKLSPSGEL
jgi:hypothetical protein